MKNIHKLVFCLLITIATSLSVSCTEEEKTKIEKKLDILDLAKNIGLTKDILRFATVDDANQLSTVEIKEETEKINSTIKLINKDIEKANNNTNEETSKNIMESVKKNIDEYKQSEEGQNNQFGWEFTKSVAQPNFSTMKDKDVLSSMDKFLHGLKRAKVIIVKGLKIASKIGGTVLKLVERFSNDPNIKNGNNKEFNTASQFLGKDGALNDIATILDDLYPTNSSLAKPVSSTPPANAITQEEKAAIARKLLSQLQLDVQADKTLNAFVNSNIPKNQKIIAKVESIVNQSIALKKQKDSLSKEEKKKESKENKKSKKAGIDVPSMQLEKIKSCAKKPEFTFFCEAPQ